MPAGLMIELGKPMGKGAKSSDDAPESGGELDDFGAALDDAFEAVKSGDKQAFKDALDAAISAKCAEMYDASEGEK